MSDRKWHAVYTRRNKEKKVADLLAKNKIATYLPLYESECIVDGRKKIVKGPLFPGYVFISLNDNEDVLKQSRDIINFVYWQSTPVAIEHDEINALKLFLNEYACTRTEKTPVAPGTQFKIENELQVRRKGNLMEANVATVKLTLHSLGEVLVAEVRKEKVEEFTYAKDSMFKTIIGS